MKKILILLLTGLAMQGMAQSPFTFQIKNAETYQPVESAFVKLKNNGKTYSAYSTPNGSVRIENVAMGDYEITISHVSYKTIVDSIKVVNGGIEHPFLDEKLIFLYPDLSFLDAAIISTVRAKNSTPSTFTNLKKEEIQLLDQSKDFPFLLNMTPSTVISSDAGNGIGYTGIRVRGIDPTRVNVTINGIPLNDAESQGVYWVNLPDLTSSTQSVQVQRGIGTSTNGPGAFGASVNIRTENAAEDPAAAVVVGIGSFNTFRASVAMSSGRLKNGWAFQGRGSTIESDGFIDRASSRLHSANLSATKFWEHSVFKANLLFGYERTFQAWWGIPQPKFEQDAGGLNQFVTNLGISGRELNQLRNSNSKTYNYYTYENEVDNYNQNHYQLFFDHYFNPRLKLNTAAYVTTGKGYFEQFRPNDDFADYGIEDVVLGGDTFSSGDLVRRRWLDNTLVGGLASLGYEVQHLELTMGAGYNTYNGRHFGEAISTMFTAYEALNAIYYDNDAVKTDANAFVKASYNYKNLIPFFDFQLRSVNYDFEGFDTDLNLSPQSVNYTFINPKAGLTYLFRNNTVYAMFAVGNREPVRDDFRNNKPEDYPEHEYMENIEVGYRFEKERSQVGINFYNMDYTNQLVLTGAVNDVGEAIRTNVSESYRRGIEMEFQTPLSDAFQVGGNATFSQNKIASFSETVGEWTPPYGVVTTEYTNTDISFSPNKIIAGLIAYKYNPNVTINANVKHVGEQFLDNTQSDNRKLDAFTTVNLGIQYENKKTEGFKKLTAGLYLNNILDLAYAPNGYTFSGYINGNRSDFNYVYPMAGFNWMMKLRLTL